MKLWLLLRDLLNIIRIFGNYCPSEPVADAACCGEGWAIKNHITNPCVKRFLLYRRYFWYPEICYKWREGLLCEKYLTPDDEDCYPGLNLDILNAMMEELESKTN